MCHSLVRRRVCGDMYICHVNTAGVPSSFLLMSIILVDSYLGRTHELMFHYPGSVMGSYENPKVDTRQKTSCTKSGENPFTKVGRTDKCI